jgi:FkbM family methyltransferase
MEQLFKITDKYFKRNEVSVILDIGSRDCQESIQLSERFPNARVFAFECNPNTLSICKSNIMKYPNINLIDKAVNTYNGTCTFYPIDQKKTVTTWKDGNPGASSLFKANGNYDVIEKYVQNEIQVPCTRVDTVCSENNLDHIDIIWMDLQGAELLALESLGSMIDKVKLIYTEVTFKPMYHGQCLFDDINNYLIKHDFVLLTPVHKNGFQQDVIYMRK